MSDVAAPSPESADVIVLPRILLVDDSPIDLGIAASLIEKNLGWPLCCASSGAEALASMESQLPAIVLTDLQMPGMNGLQLVDEIRRIHPQTPVVLMTAHGSEKIAMEALRRGAASYVPKSSIDLDLASTLEQVLSSAAQECELQEVEQRLKRAEFQYVLENDPSLVPKLVSRLTRHLNQILPLSRREETQVGVALLEAILNALYHGNLEVSSDLKLDGDAPFYRLVRERQKQLPYCARRIHVSAFYTREEAAFVIRDEGPGFDVAILPDPTDPENLCKPCGRGSMLMRTFMDEVVYNPAGNEVTLRKRLGIN